MPQSAQASFVEVKDSPFHGRGLFAARAIVPGTVIAVYPLLVLSTEDTATVRSTLLHHYVFYVDENAEGEMRAAVAFGEISMCNHSRKANADFTIDASARTVTLTARQAIAPDDEILIDYEEFADEII
ncbi:SET domain-containing protein [Hyphomonas sp.]|uniref:SET domain-containing protein n=1 Tax=Hyphomonas sp. TaxID=87 RepID=UPI003F6F8785|tara:strand:+ start:282 stop:665 length:384 start_codon:yes stop_codon:yes gene_type:complete